MSWNLPTEFSLPSGTYGINADFRDILEIITQLHKEENTEYERLYISLFLFFNNFENAPEEDYEKAINFMFYFISCGETQEENLNNVKQIDWEQDANLIVSDINKVAACEIRSLPFLHWWSFISFFNSIGDGQLSCVVSIREKKRKGQRLEKWEQDYYTKNKAKVDFKKKYTQAELCEIARLKDILQADD